MGAVVGAIVAPAWWEKFRERQWKRRYNKRYNGDE